MTPLPPPAGDPAPPAPPRPLVCVGALVRGPQGGGPRYLIVRTTKWRGAWGVPGGKVEYGETLEEATLREFREEVGLELRDLRYAQTQQAVLSPEFHQPAHLLLIDFLAGSKTWEVAPNEEIVEWAWVGLEEGLGYPLNSFTRALLELARREGGA